MSYRPAVARTLAEAVLKKRTLNQLLLIHFGIIGVLLLGWLAVGGPIFQKACFFYAFFGWVGLRLLNRRAWKRHFHPRGAR